MRNKASIVASCRALPLVLGLGSPAVAQFASFTRPSDSITFDTTCISVPNHISYEAVIRLGLPQAQSAGIIYNEILPFWFDRQLAVGAGTLYEYTHPIDSGTGWQVAADLGVGTWRHIAFCYDGAEERFYLDGQLIGSRPRTGDIATACSSSPPQGNGAIGRVVRQGSLTYSSFLGDLAWIRISASARYAGTAFSPPGPADVPASDADTMLLFALGDCSSGLIADRGPLHRDGTFAGNGGTSPGNCCPADLDDDGSFANGANRDRAVTIDDLLYFLAGYEAGSAAVDLDDGSGTGARDGAVTIEDLLFFLAHYEAGC